MLHNIPDQIANHESTINKFTISTIISVTTYLKIFQSCSVILSTAASKVLANLINYEKNPEIALLNKILSSVNSSINSFIEKRQHSIT